MTKFNGIDLDSITIENEVDAEIIEDIKAGRTKEVITRCPPEHLLAGVMIFGIVLLTPLDKHELKFVQINLTINIVYNCRAKILSLAVMTMISFVFIPVQLEIHVAFVDKIGLLSL